ncbi:hypothetical protein ACWDR7_05620 [Microbacterium sp. NPDC003461]
MPENDALRAWATLLDRFERDLAPGAAPAPWTRPAAELPPELEARARRVLQAQRERVAALARERDETLAQLTALRRVPGAPEGRPAYVDLDG